MQYLAELSTSYAQDDRNTKSIKVHSSFSSMLKDIQNWGHIKIIFVSRGKGELPGESKPIQTVKKYGNKLKTQLQQEGSSFAKNSDTVLRRPRYVRINVLLASKKEVTYILHF